MENYETCLVYNADGALCADLARDNSSDLPWSNYAKEVRNPSGNISYFVKKVNYGADASHLLNPISQFGEASSEGHRKERTGKSYASYHKVNQECFNLYLKFLQTKNLSYLRNAERELING